MNRQRYDEKQFGQKIVLNKLMSRHSDSSETIYRALASKGSQLEKLSLV